MQLFVLGMHRSGTSAVTRILNLAGAYFGPEGISNGADEGNPKGFWERLDIRRVCDGLLQDSGFDWWRLADFSVDAIPEEVREEHLGELQRILLELDAHRPWVLKEPRLSLLFPLVRPLLEVPVCIHVSREPLEVADSLRVRNGIPVSVGLALWERYTIHAFEASEGLPRLLVRYEDLMADPIAVVGRLIADLEGLGVQGLRVPSDKEISAFLTAELHRQRRSPEDRADWLTQRQAALVVSHDEARIPDRAEMGDVSEGARGAMRSYELLRDEQRDAGLAADEALAAAQAETADVQAQAAADLVAATEVAAAELAIVRAEVAQAEADTAAVRAELEGEREFTARRNELVNEALGRAQRQVQLLARSRAYRTAGSASKVGRRLAGTAREKGPVDKLAADIRRARNHLEREPRDEEEARGPRAPARVPATAAAPAAETSSTRPSVAVIAWDVGHNPLGRAFVMADMLRRHVDVEIWGAQFERYGQEVWPPLRDIDIPVHTFPGRPFPDHLTAMEEVAGRIEADAIWVSKARFPSMGLGVLAAQARPRPLVLDVDDHELSFFAGAGPIEPSSLLGRAGEEDVSLPFGQAWTQACESVVDAFAHLTVSNVALQQRFGGTIVPHARDERVFEPDLYDRQEVRASLGLDDSHRLLLFGGTPRVHKGVVEVVQALDRLGDDRYRLLCFGTREFNDVRRAIGELERWTIVLPNQPFAALPPLVGAADLACVLQDPTHPVAQYQMPAKITDALAMAVPLLVSPVPPVMPLVDAGVVHVHDGAVPLHERIDAIFADPADARERAARGRKLFLGSYSYDAVGTAAAGLLTADLADPVPLSPRLTSFAALPREVFTDAAAARPAASTPSVARVPGRRTRPIAPGATFDVVAFWKQNDSGIYGRRQDMFMKYLARSGRVGTIVHFDRPTTPEELLATFRKGRGGTDQNRLVASETLARILRRRDQPQIQNRTYLHGGPRTARLGFRPQRREVDHVRSVLARAGIGERPTILWAYPTNDDLPALIDAIDPDLVVTDVVDDHRTFAAPGSERYEQFDRNYREVLARSDVVLANCDPVAEAMAGLGPEVHVVQNGCEILARPASRPVPPELQGLKGPIVGYVGNLSQRLDVDLLDRLVMAHPEWQFVFVGSAHHDKSVLVLESEPNVHFVGVKRYEEMLDFVAHFDVALIPHLVNDITRSMNPLKAFVYGAAGVPVVSTPVANLAEFEGLITVARGPRHFGEAIEAALRVGRHDPDVDVLQPHSWEARIDQVLALIDQAVEGDSAP